MEATSYHGRSYESFEDAVANAGVPSGNVPVAYAVSLGYVPPAGVVGKAEFHATLSVLTSLQQPGESAVG